MPQEVLPGVYAVRIRMGYVSAFIIARDSLTLIDSGLPGQKDTFIKAIYRIAREPESLRDILITHHHVDHTGSLAALIAETKARAYAHPLDAPIVRGEKPVPGPNPKSRAGKVIVPLIKRISPSRLEPVTLEREVQDGDVLPVAGEITVVHTPGHTAGHVSYLWPERGGVLFAGDAAGHLLGRLGLPAGMFTEDTEQAKASMRKLAVLEFDTACFGHGTVLKGKANAAFRRYVEKQAK